MLISQAGSGSDAAWAELIRRYYRRSVRFAAGMLADCSWQVAEEVAQTAWGQIAAQLQRGTRIELFWPYLALVVRRRVVDELRSRHRRRRIESLILDAPQDWLDPESGTVGSFIKQPGARDVDELVMIDEKRVLGKALSMLSERDRVLVLARVVKGFSCKQSTRLLLQRGLMEPGGDAVKRAENYYYRALAQLRRYIEPEMIA